MRWCGAPNDFGSQHGEGSDIVVAHDQSGFVISGHGQGPMGVSGTLSGRLSKISAAGSYLWGYSYSSIDYSLGQSTRLIKNECWGLKAMVDGYVVGCGTGIEHCDGYTGQMLSDCNAGTADPRPGAVARGASIWQSMIFRTDLNGGQLWLRTDQYRSDSSPALGESGWVPQSSASEFVIVTSDSDIVSINDETSGVGLLRLSDTTSSPTAIPTISTAVPSATPTTAQTQMPTITSAAPSAAPTIASDDSTGSDKNKAIGIGVGTAIGVIAIMALIYVLYIKDKNKLVVPTASPNATDNSAVVIESLDASTGNSAKNIVRITSI